MPLFRTPFLKALIELEREFGMTLQCLPNPVMLQNRFEALRRPRRLTHPASVALMYRLVVLNYTAAALVMRHKGVKNCTADRYAFCLRLLAASNEWRARSSDRAKLDPVILDLDDRLAGFLELLGLELPARGTVLLAARNPARPPGLSARPVRRRGFPEARMA